MQPKFLPALDQTSSAPSPGGGEGVWSPYASGPSALVNFASVLDVPKTHTPAEKLKSIPTPWARLLLFEQALFSPHHPAHEQVLGEWRGLLGVLALSQYLRLRVHATAVDLDHSSEVIRSLWRMAPKGDEVAWQRLGLIWADNRLVGGTSPRSLVFTGIRRAVPSSIPFQRNGRVIDPARHYQEQEDRESLSVLLEWLDELHRSLHENATQLATFLGDAPTGSNAQSISRAARILDLIKDWRDDTYRAVSDLGGAISSRTSYADSPLRPTFPDKHPGRPIFQLLRPITVSDAAGTGPDLRLSVSDRVIDPGASGVVVRDGQTFTGQIRLAPGQMRNMRDGRFVLPTQAAHLGDEMAPDLGKYIQPKLIAVTDADPNNTIALRAGGTTFLFPFSKQILNYLEPEQLARWTRLSGDPATEVTATLEFPLRNGLSLKYERHFTPHDILRDLSTPQLAVWPDFRAEGWDHHFFFTRQPQARGGGLTISPVVEMADGDQHRAPERRVRWGRLREHSPAWEVSGDDAVGLLVMNPLDLVPSTAEEWDISIDFGSTHTRVFRANQTVGGGPRPEPVILTPRALTLLGDSSQLPLHFFAAHDNSTGSVEEPRSLVWLPLQRALGRSGEWLPADGIIYWQSSLEVPNIQGLRSHLKWHEDDSEDQEAFRSYISQLYLSVAAEAAAQGARVRSFITAYPSVFPEHLRYRHEAEWGRLEKLYNVTMKSALSESTALASYLVKAKAAPITVNLLAIDVGGSTSDLAVWAGGTKARGDSVRLAGDILSRLIATDAKAREAIATAARRPPLQKRDIPWNDQGGEQNSLVFNALLREVARTSGSTVPLAKTLYEPGKAGAHVIAHIAYLFAALSFLLGLMARRERLADDAYNIHFAGRGSEFLRWLEVLGHDAPVSIPRTFFLAGFSDDPDGFDASVAFPEHDAKQEVGRGLLTPLTHDGRAASERETFIGESGFFAAQELGWDDPLTIDVLRRLKRPESRFPAEQLAVLRKFIETFSKNPAAQTAATTLNIQAAILDRELRDKIVNRLFGPGSAWAQAQTPGATGDHALLEPFFIVEAKTLLEHATGNHQLFAS
jgi:hypothetical protein